MVSYERGYGRIVDTKASEVGRSRRRVEDFQGGFAEMDIECV